MLSAEQRLLGSMSIRPLGPTTSLTELVARVEPLRPREVQSPQQAM